MIIVAKADRISRDINQYYAYKALLSKIGLDIISVTEDWSAQDKLTAMILENFLAMAATVERENIRVRTSGGRKIKASKGGYSGGKPPYGYTPQNGKLVIVPEEAEVVRYVINAKDSGKTFQTICDALNAQGKTNRSGTKFSISTLQVIIGNKPLYQGMYRYGKDSEWVDGEHEPILTEVNV
jgi:DNA invertase Pin-like site-specific DNA recombinase